MHFVEGLFNNAFTVCFRGYKKCGSGCVPIDDTADCETMNQCEFTKALLKRTQGTPNPVHTSCSMIGTEFTCADGVTCLSKEWILDGQADCEDSSDEGLRGKGFRRL